jgi:hypothetical protein
MSELFDQIAALIDADERDLDRIERTLTDGYARALALQGERWRLEKRLAEVAQELDGGDTTVKTRELAGISARLTGNEGELSELRGRLGELRRYAEAVRV